MRWLFVEEDFNGDDIGRFVEAHDSGANWLLFVVAEEDDLSTGDLHTRPRPRTKDLRMVGLVDLVWVVPDVIRLDVHERYPRRRADGAGERLRIWVDKCAARKRSTLGPCRSGTLVVVLTLDEIRALAAGGEGERVEFKKSTAEADRGAQTVAGMANRGGGFVVFGIDPAGKVVGQDVTERTLEKVSDQLARILPTPVTSVSNVALDASLSLVVVEVESGPLRPYRWNGRTNVRVGASTKEVGEEQAQQMLIEAKHRGFRWEDESSGLSFDDLDADEIQQTVTDAVRLAASQSQKGTRFPACCEGSGC
jgi:Putative DNA-binding domain